MSRRQADLVGRYQHLPLLVDHAEGVVQLQAVFAHAALGVDAENGLLAAVDQLLEGGIGLLGIVDDLSAAGAALM
jgi:hypothetical protein